VWSICGAYYKKAVYIQLHRQCQSISLVGTRLRVGIAQGTVAGVPIKLWLEDERILFVVPVPYVHDFEARYLSFS